MKKIYIAMAVLATVFAGCSKEVEYTNDDLAEVNSGEVVTLKTNMAEPETKMSIDGYKAFGWQTGDVISVLNSAGEPTDFSTTGSGTTVDFTGTFASGSLGKYAMYPASTGHLADNDEIVFNLPSTLDWSADATFIPMLGKINAGVGTFKAVGGVLKLVCYNIPDGAAYMWFISANSQITGDFTIADGTVDSPVIATSSATDDVLQINFTHSSNKVFYIPLPTGEIDGFTVEFYNSSDVELFSKSTTAKFTVSRNQMTIAPALNCNVMADKVVTNAEIINDVPSSYGSGTIESASGNWPFSKAMKQTTSGTTRMQIAASENLQLPSFASNISTITLHSTGNGGGSGFNGTVYFSESSSVEDAITSQAHNGALGTDVVINVPTGYKTGYIIPSGAFRVASITVSFEKVGSFPSLTPSNDNMTIAVGSTEASTAFTFANKVDEIPVAVVVNAEASSWLSAAITGTYPNYTLTVTATGAHNGAADRVGTVTLKATGVNKSITVTQRTCLVPNPTVTATPGDGKFSASWTGAEHASSYVAYLRTSEGEPTDGTNISASISKSAGVYSITDYAVANGTYYLYVKVNGVDANYEAPATYVMKSFTCEGTPKGYSAENPYSVAEAIAAAEALGGGNADDVYVLGIVSQIITAYNDTYNNVSFNISADGLTSGDQFYAYRTVASSADDVAVGDCVILKGTLKVFNSKPELDAANTIEQSLRMPSFTGGDASFTTSTSVTLSAAAGATIYYTTDSSTPTTTSTAYSAAIPVSETTTVKAIAAKDGLVTGVASKTFSKSSGDKEWVKVTDASSLAAGDKLILVSTVSGSKTDSYNGTFAADGSISSNIMGKVSATITGNKLTSYAGAQEFILGGTTGNWTLSNGSQLLGATAVKKIAWGAGTTTWTISISDGNATIECTETSYGKIKYNRDSPRFTTYTGDFSASMAAPMIFRYE